MTKYNHVILLEVELYQHVYQLERPGLDYFLLYRDLPIKMLRGSIFTQVVASLLCKQAVYKIYGDDFLRVQNDVLNVL